VTNGFRDLIAIHSVRQFFRFATLTALVGLFAGSAPIFAADQTFNITYLGEASNPAVNGLPTACNPAAATNCVYGDIWAENGYAYVGTDVNNGGVNIFSISNPANPIFLTKYSGNQMEDVEVWDGIGYFSSDVNSTGTGVDIVDLSIPFDPILMSRFDDTDCNAAGCGFGKVHTLSVAKTADDRSFLYTTDNAYTDQVKIIDVTSCVKTATCNPQLAATADMGLNPNPRGQESGIYSHEVIVRNDRMYVASKNNGNSTGDGWVNIFDVHDPANPILLTKFLSGGRTHTALPSADGTLLITAEEHATTVSNPTNVKIYDISMIDSPNDPDSPVLLSTINSLGVGIEATSPHHPHLHGNLLFLPWYEAGLQVFNISDPAHPVRVGSFDTYVGSTPTSYAGNWGVDLSLGLKRVMLSDRNRGLIVVDASGVVAPGDYDQNMSVAAADYEAWRSTFGNSTSGLHVAAFADGNYNNAVDAADYVIWRKHLGETGPTHPGSGDGGAVPEPAAVVLFGAGLALISAGRRCRTK
jgi:hypothetical protein